MRNNEMVTDDDAVSPVIGVILMVAITVILAAVIATFVLGLGEQISNTAPSASFIYDYNETGTDLTITHTGGQPLDNSSISIGGDVRPSDVTSQWGVDTISAGDSLVVNANSEDEVLIIWESADGDQTAVLSEW